jgi:UDP-N-acetylmuramoyl-L-alanyl-D-glutamate--2,6-diaminopimelate ligase
MKTMDLAELISGLKVAAAPASLVEAKGVRICDITDDSRTVLPGSLFIARVGTKSDGRRFIPDAVALGAAAILTDAAGIDGDLGGGLPLLTADNLPVAAAEIAERFYGNPTSKLALIGITGTNGKTTTAHLVHQILCGSGVRCGLIGTVVVDDGVAAGPATLTTPPAMELSRTFGVMVEAGCRAAVMETSSHALEQGRVAALLYDVAVFTNLTGDHLDYHGTMESYAGAKARLFTMLPERGWAIVNEEDPWTARILQDCRARVLRCCVQEAAGPLFEHQHAGRGDEAPGAAARCEDMAAGAGERCCATIRSMNMAGTDVTFVGPWGRFEARLRLIGRHNVMNALQAVAVSWTQGVAPAVLARQVERAAPPPGRLEPVTGARHAYQVLVDYAHTDDALRKVMAAVAPLVARGEGGGPVGRLCIVFGCGGDRDRTKRPRMGAAAAELANVVFVTSDNPRTERPSDIVDGILAGVPSGYRHKVQVDVDRRRAIRKAIEQARAGDIVLIAGKGHEKDQIVSDGMGGTVKHHFDDCEVAREALAELRRPGKVEPPP